MANLISFALDSRVKTAFGTDMRPLTFATLIAAMFTAANVFSTWSNPVPWWAYLGAFLFFTALTLGFTKATAKEIAPARYELPQSKGMIIFSVVMAVIFAVVLVFYTVT